MACVPIIPTMRLRVAWAAARVPGSTTPTTGIPACAAMSSMALTSTELHATTSIFTSRATR